MGTEPYVSTIPVRLDAANQCLWRDGQSIPLTPKAFTVLRYLTERPGQLVMKEELLNAAWPGVYVTDAALKVCIRRLRQVLGDLAHPARYIETVHWRGYRLLTPIPAAPPPAPSSGVQGVNAIADTHDAPATVIREEASNRTTEPSAPPPRPAAPDGRRLAPQPFPSPLVGREAELQQLLHSLETARRGNRHTVFVTGASGIGKTAIVDAFLATVAADPRVWIARGQCIEHYGAGESYLPVLEALTYLCRAPEGERLVSVLRQHAPMWLAQLPALLGPAERKRLRREAQGSSRERMLREMAEAVEAFTRDCTLILALEDVHWSDYATLDLLSFLARRGGPARLLLLGVYRPEELTQPGHPLKHIKHTLHTHRQCEERAIPPLSPEIINAYLQQRFPGHIFPPVLAALLHKRTGGNPLFLINVLDHFVAHGLIVRQDSHWSLNGALADIQTEMPTSLQQIIAAQIDRLTVEEQRILEVASVAGVDFSAAAVAAGLEAEIVDIETSCEGLARRGQFVCSQGASEWPDGTVAARYEFLHSLYQQAWYERVTAGRRARLHQRLGERGERAYGERGHEIAAELAVHFECGRDLHRAVRYRYQAADNAARRFGYQEAISHLTRGLALLSTQSSTPERDQQEIALQSALGAAHLATQGYAAPAVEQAYARAYTLCRQVEAAPSLAPAIHGLWIYYLARAEFPAAKALAEQLWRVAQREQNQALLLEAERELGQTLHLLGALPESRRYLECGIGRYDPHKYASHIFLYGQDPGVVCLAQNARTLCLMGYLDQAIRQADAAITLAREVAHPYSLALAQYQAAVIHYTRRDPQRTQAVLEATVALSPEHGIPYWLSSMQVLKGWVLANQGEREAGIQVMRQGLATSWEVGTRLNRPYSLVLLAEMYGGAGEAQEGLALLREARQLAERNAGYFYLVEIYRLQGELTLQQHRAGRAKPATPHSQLPTADARAAAEAEACFQQALTVAQQQGARLLELRAAMSLSRLWRRQGKAAHARRLLAEIYGWFTEGFDTVDLQEAKALLAQLSG